MKKRLLKLSPLALALLTVSPVQAAPLTAGDSGLQIDVLGFSVDTSKTKSRNSLIQVIEPKRFILELEGEAAAVHQQYRAAKTLSGKLDPSAVQVQQYQRQLKSGQLQILQEVKKRFPDVVAARQFSLLMNGLVVEGQQLTMEELAAIPGVKKVYEDKLVHVSMDVSLPLINAEAAWQLSNNQENAGKGIRVAVIDSGIWPDNPMFDDQGMDAPDADSLPTDDYCRTTEPAFCNNKLIVARHYAASASTIAEEYRTPRGYNSHGTHVAGTAAGRSVQVSYGGEDLDISGVAPGAWLMSYKALYYNGTTASGLTSSLLAAMEDAVADGADVINNSWGGGAGGSPENSAYKAVYEAAEQAGVIVVTAAGNDGNGDGTIGCPGCIEAGITVANTQTGKAFAQFMNVSGMEPIITVEGSSPVQLKELTSADLTGNIIAAALVTPDNFEGCQPFAADTFSGGYALIQRGTCAFDDKAINAAAAGAKAVIIQNNAEGSLSSMLMPGSTIPGVMISKADGETLLAALENGGLQATLSPDITRYSLPETINAVNSSSSRGPNGDNRFIKPDISAPGTSIVSAASPRSAGGDFTHMTGTSMASPHVAGVAALLKAKHPQWTALQIKSALTSTSNPDVRNDDTVTRANAFAKGAGLVDAPAALNARLAMAPVSVAGPDCVEQCTFAINVSSLSDTPFNWTGSVLFEDQNISANLTVADSNTSVLVFDTNTRELQVNLTVETGAATRDTWHFGEIIWRPADSSVPVARMPVAVFAGNSSDSKVLTSTGATIKAGQTEKLQTVLTNSRFSGSLDLKIVLPEPVELEGTPLVSITDGVQDSLSFDEENNTVNWSGSLNRLTAQLAPDSFWAGFPSLTDFLDPADIYVFSCAPDCDESSVNLNVSGLGAVFMGQELSSVRLGTNGYIAFNGASLSSSFQNDTMPTDRANGALLAPFWTDLDLTGTGAFLAGELSDGTNNYLVFEWKDAKLYGDASANTYTFQVILQLGGGGIYVNYVDLGTIPAALTVGLQDLSGDVGSSHYFDGQGVAPVSGSAYAVEYLSAGSVTVEYLVSSALLTVNDMAWSVYQDSPVSRNLLSNAALNASRNLIYSDVGQDGQSLAGALSLLVTEPEGNAVSAELATLPARGSVVLDGNGNATYTPAEGFYGTDSFGFRLIDEAGNKSAEATITVNVQQKAKDDSAGTFGYWLLLGLLLLLPQRICQQRAGSNCS